MYKIYLKTSALLWILVLSSFLSSAQKATLKQVKVSYQGVLTECVIRVNDNYGSCDIILNAEGQVLRKVFLPSEGISTISYFDDMSPEYLQGRIRQMANMGIEYFREPSVYSGKMKSIGSTLIEYDKRNDRRVYRIGNLYFGYYHFKRSGETKDLVIKIGDVEIIQYTRETNVHSMGKISRIGNYRFEYFTPLDENGKDGKIKAVTGTKDDFEILIMY